MAPVLKVKRLKKSIKSKSTAVANTKLKWEKPKKSISAQAKVTKIKNVNKHSFDPIKANRGVVLLKNIPHGFYEDQMRKYFGQFGLVTRIRLARSQRTGRSKGFAYIEFKVPEVAQIAADTMNNYIMFKHVLKTTYIPPDKQTYNFFRKDVTFTTDSNGQVSFSSDKFKGIEDEIEKINRVPTDEEHAKRLKRTEKTLKKQQKKYGVDLTNVMVSGNNNLDESASSIEVKPTEKKKKDKAAKNVVDKRAEAKVDVPKVEKKKEITAKKDKKKLENSNGGKSLLSSLLNETYETDTSDDDFKIDHSFNASGEDSDDSSTRKNGESLVDLFRKKLSSRNKKSTDSSSMEVSNSEDDEESDDQELSEESTDDDLDDSDDHIQLADEVDSDDDEPEIVVPISKGKKKPNELITSNRAPNAKGKAVLKRKLPESVLNEQVTLNSQSELETTTVAKKKKQSQTKKTENLSNTGTSSSEPEASKYQMKKNAQKKNQPSQLTSTSGTSSEHGPVIQKKKQKKTEKKQLPQVESTSTLTKPPTLTNLSKLDNGNQKMKKKNALNGKKRPSNSSIAETTSSSEPEVTKPKNNAKKNTNASDPKPVNAKVGKDKPAPVVSKSKALKANQQTVKDDNSKTSSPDASSKPEVQNQKMNKKQKTIANDEYYPLKTEPVKLVKKQKKLKAVTSSLISDSGFAKKPIQPKTKRNPEKSADKSSAWTTVSETDGEDTKKSKATGNASLKTIVRKNVSKKKNDGVKLLDVKKIKQTPDELLQLISSKELKQSNKLKTKKKSK